MFRHAEYHHPELAPYCSGTWTEIVSSWIIAATVIGTVLLSL